MGVGAGGNEGPGKSLRGSAGNTVRKRELDLGVLFFGKETVRNIEDHKEENKRSITMNCLVLARRTLSLPLISASLMTWIERKRALWRAAMSW